MDPNSIKEFIEFSKLGTNIILIFGLVVIWKEYLKVQGQYQSLLERCVVALIEVKNVLSSEKK